MQDLLRLTLTPNLGPVLINRLLNCFDDNASRVVGASESELSTVDHIGPARARDILRGPDAGVLERELASVQACGVDLIPISDRRYPGLLRQIYDPPPLLYARGTLPGQEALTIAVVGSRRCSGYGRDQAGRIASTLAQFGFIIVSGGAHGIDTSAHRGALQVKGTTVVVLGSGLTDPYPIENRAMFEEIIQQGGCILSEFPMVTPPVPENFPRRNRIISGLSLGTLVVEAATRSGALITARLACDDHNRPVFALPGRVDAPTSAGCHQIIREGWATLVTGAKDILEALEGSQHLLRSAAEQGASHQMETAVASDQEPAGDPERTPDFRSRGLTESQQRIYEALSGQSPMPLDELAAATGLEVSRLQADVTILQLRGLAVHVPAAGLQRKA